MTIIPYTCSKQTMSYMWRCYNAWPSTMSRPQARVFKTQSTLVSTFALKQQLRNTLVFFHQQTGIVICINIFSATHGTTTYIEKWNKTYQKKNTERKRRMTRIQFQHFLCLWIFCYMFVKFGVQTDQKYNILRMLDSPSTCNEERCN